MEPLSSMVPMSPQPDDRLTALLAAGPQPLLIGGDWVQAASGRSFATFDPSTREVLAQVAEGGAEDIDRAVAAARRAFEGPWSRFKPAQRQDLLLKLSDLVERDYDTLALLDSRDMGAPITRTRGGRERVRNLLRWYAARATGIQGQTIATSTPGEYTTYTVKEPVGVVGAIIPWNNPIASTCGKIGAALATGCTLVIKPSEESPLSALQLARLCLEAGVPPGVVNVVSGFGEDAGHALATHMDVDKLAFTGSHLTGKKIVQASASNLKRLSLELGGKSPDIVFADADLDEAVPGAAMAVFMNSGQICAAGTRLFVEDAIYDDFVARVADYARTLRVGPSLDAATQIGPLVSAAQFARVQGYLDIGRIEGARLVTGGARATQGELAGGWFVAPTVFADVADGMRIAQEEIFGPVISAIRFRDIDEVITRANRTHFGLASGIWTRDVRKAHHVASRLRAGTVWINCYNLADPAMPFGGYKMSGYGRERGEQHLDEHLQVKSVWLRTG